MLNRIVLLGRLTADPETKQTPNGVSVATFTIAVDRNFTAKGQEKQTDFIPCVAWRATADFIGKYFQKGSLIAVDGSLQTRKFTDKQGNNRTAYEVIVDQVSFAGSKQDGGQPAPQQRPVAQQPQRSNSIDVDFGDFEEVDPFGLPF